MLQSEAGYNPATFLAPYHFADDQRAASPDHDLRNEHEHIAQPRRAKEHLRNHWCQNGILKCVIFDVVTPDDDGRTAFGNGKTRPPRAIWQLALRLASR